GVSLQSTYNRKRASRTRCCPRARHRPEYPRQLEIFRLSWPRSSNITRRNRASRPCYLADTMCLPPSSALEDPNVSKDRLQGQTRKDKDRVPQPSGVPPLPSPRPVLERTPLTVSCSHERSPRGAGVGHAVRHLS